MSGDERPRIDPKQTISLQRLQTVRDLTPRQWDELPFGVIQIDRDGVVSAYNRAESRLAGKDPRDVIGRNFFTEIAPCTNVQDFAGRLERGLREPRMCEIFPFVFPFPSGPVDVTITIYREAPDERIWILVDAADDGDAPT